MKSFKAVATLALFGVIVSAKINPAVRRMDVEARHHEIAMEKRALVPDILGDGGGNNSTGNGTGGGDNNSSSANQTQTTPDNNNQQTTSTTTQANNNGNNGGNNNNNQPTTSTTTTPDPVQPTTTTTTQVPTTSTTPTTTTQQTTSVAAGGTTVARLTSDTYQGISLYSNTAAVTGLRASQTDTAGDSSSTDAASSNGSLLHNKSATAAVFTILGIVTAGALVFVGFWFYKKSNRGKLGEEDMWDEASMKEFHGPPPGMSIAAPSAAVLNDSIPGLGRKNTIMPSQSAGAGPVTRTKSTTSSGRRDLVPDEEEPDEMLALPPVKNYERPRDSAYDIVPAAPPVAAYASQGGGYGYGYNSNAYASSSSAAAAAAGPSSFHPPKRGDHTSFGSGLGNDPFAGTGFTDATRESSFGPGQAGRGAGYNMGGSSSGHGHDAQVGAGNQWPQGYNPYTGYSQGSQQAYGNNGYGGQGYYAQ